MMRRLVKLTYMKKNKKLEEATLEAQTNYKIYKNLEKEENYINTEIDLLKERINQFSINWIDDKDVYDRWKEEEYLAESALLDFENWRDLKDLKEDLDEGYSDETFDEDLKDFKDIELEENSEIKSLIYEVEKDKER